MRRLPYFGKYTAAAKGYLSIISFMIGSTNISVICFSQKGHFHFRVCQFILMIFLRSKQVKWVQNLPLAGVLIGSELRIHFKEIWIPGISRLLGTDRKLLFRRSSDFSYLRILCSILLKSCYVDNLFALKIPIKWPS